MAIELPTAVLTNLNKASGKLLEVHGMLDKLERAGQDVSDARALITTWQDAIAKHKAEFFPNSR